MTVTSSSATRSFVALAFVTCAATLAYESVLAGAPTSRPPVPVEALSAPAPAAVVCTGQDGHGASGSPEACLICHEDLRKVVEASVPHLPVSDGECTMCHNAHAARYPKLLSKRGRALCYGCHKEQVDGFQTGHVHSPVRKGECQACHDVHGSENAGLLSLVGNELCLSCHEEMQASLQSPTVHEPVAEGECADCHQSHNSPFPNQLVAPAQALCTLCHDATDEDLIEAHLGIPIEGSRCDSCHDAHASSHKGLLREHAHEPFADQSCDMCHLVDSDTPRVVVATDGRLCAMCHEEYPRQGDPVVHAPVGEGKCTACHEVHATSFDGLLKGPVSEVCHECHGDLAVRRERSRSAHPMDDEEVGCASCHAPHSSKEEHLLENGAIRTCLVCHEGQRHGHPLGGDRLDPRTGKTITCVTCHDPHGTDFPMQLRGDQTRGLCLECHNGDEGGHSGGG